ncbi:hypothetical protein GALMADRAFT_254444 [Galerina marginata CBS 339.88]|uniref:F-box domain-containing protein n=1 Tax=Galerina marginata (strain CBS 339.88) TaxID=685588 RepID=A0A067SIV6_GALM3|nr:hypothetical protein GALMADRAFT_254444 [Galerina marginata CBS 339.88]
MNTPRPKGSIPEAINPALASLSFSQPQLPTFLSLPPELLTQILLHLTSHPATLRACKLTCKHLHTVIHTSLSLVYHAVLHATQQNDNPASPMPVSEKIRWLEESSRRWAALDLDQDPGLAVGGGGGVGGTPDGPVETKRIKELKLGHVPNGIVYGLTGGIYLLGDAEHTALYWIMLPGKAELLDDKQPSWNKIDLEALRHHPDSDGRERRIVNTGLCIYEHDLVAIITVTPHQITPTTQIDVDIMLLQFSTGLPHPLLVPGQTFLKRVCTAPTEWDRPASRIEIVGDHLVLVLYFPNADAQLTLAPPDDQVYIWDWKTGVLKLSFTAPVRTYAGLVFLTPQLIVLPNMRTNALDVLRIPQEPTFGQSASEPIVSLGLPPLAEGRELGGVSCRAEPNPVGYDHPDINTNTETTPTRPFRPRAENALCIFSLRVIGGPMVQPNVQFEHTFSFVVHRSALVELVQRWAPRLAPSSSDNDNAAGIPTLSASPAQSLPKSVIPYPSWGGPRLTRWFNANAVPPRWITTTSGQRLVLTSPPSPERPNGYPYCVLDFSRECLRPVEAAVRAEKVRRDRERRHKSGYEKLRRAKDRLLQLLRRREAAEAEAEVEANNESGRRDMGVQTELEADPESDDDDDKPSLPTSSSIHPSASASSPLSRSSHSAPLTFCRHFYIAYSEPLEPSAAFAEPVVSALPFVACTSPRYYKFDGLLLDEERVIGVETDALDRIKRIEVHYFG